MRIDIIAAVPSIVEGALPHSIVGRAIDDDLVRLVVHDLHDYGIGRHRQIDDYPYGGGGGMVLRPEPLFACLEHIDSEALPDEVIYLSPDGTPLVQSVVNELSLSSHLVLIAGHYKGIDERVRTARVTREISIGDYVLTGGELPALVLVDALVRLIPGVLGDAASALTDSFQDGLLGAPVYTRPAEFKGMAVPEELLSGDHERIAEWREAQRELKTTTRRPDLYRSRAGEDEAVGGSAGLVNR
jgi:tRNA (guanine37-N1)-methyltransferase